MFFPAVCTLICTLNPGGFGDLDKYPALVLHYSGVLLLLLLRFPRILTGESYYSTS
jgi:hypothetical protein